MLFKGYTSKDVFPFHLSWLLVQEDAVEASNSAAELARGSTGTSLSSRETASAVALGAEEIRFRALLTLGEDEAALKHSREVSTFHKEDTSNERLTKYLQYLCGEVQLNSTEAS